MSASAKDIREAAGYSQMKAAVLADVAINTWRMFELASDAVSRKNRIKCGRALVAMREKAATNHSKESP